MTLSSPAPTETSRRLLVAALIPLAAFGLQWFFWAAIQPYVWFLFFPAVFFSSWVGGLRGGVMATVLSAGLAWYVFIPPQFSFGIQTPMSLVSIGMFVVMGVLFSVFHGRLWQANQQAADAVAAVQAANHQLEARVLQRTADLQQANADLRESEERFHSAMQYAAIGMALVAPDGRWLDVNRALCQIVGYTREELLATTFQAITHPDDLNTDLSNVRLMLERKLETYQMEKRYLHQRGGVVWVLLSVSLVWRDDGSPHYFISQIEDITERKRVEQALRESEAKWRALFAESADGMILADPATRQFRVVNEQICRMLGYAESELKAMSVADLHPPANLPAVLEEFHRQARGELKVAEALPMLRKDGSIFFADVTAAIVVVDGERLLLGAFRDITERKRAEEELARHREQLERLVAERTNDLTDARTAALSLMQDAQRQERRVAEALAAQRVLTAKLDEANAELESFSYSVSHDLRAPLRHVQGYVEMLQRATDGQLSDLALRYLKTISDASVEMGQLIDDLLAFSRIGRIERNESTVHLDAVVQDAIRGLEMATRSRNIVWQVAPLPPVLGDPSLLKQVLVNLIGNAVKYSGQRDPAHIEIGCAGEEDGRVILFVRDNGAGFDMQYAHKLFGVFQRLHRAEEFEGTGIGLATVRRIIARHGGRVWAEGALNQGATFYFTLTPSRTA